jgi:Protein of unknown function (DUF3551)
MRATLVALGVLAAAAVANIEPADAQQQQRYPWCAEMYDFATECTFRSREQCEADVSGLGGFCYENPAYSGSDSLRAPR